ncbi:hypothetical protein DFH09DRAFT_1295779 [Mycena vulgaris]|nr:hypothetical protein DFH09DRAFT_1295779 [Mycena vulgaris]
MYCSKKCQREHCLFNAVLQACFALQLDLVRAQLDKPFVVLVAIERVDFRDFCRIFTGQPLDAEPFMGMVQLNSFLPYSPTQAAELLSTKHVAWCQHRDSLNAHSPECTYLNTCVRNDTKNDMFLRTEMRPSDIKVIRDAGAGSESFNALILRDKMEREAIFKPLVTWKKRRAGQ